MMRVYSCLYSFNRVELVGLTADELVWNRNDSYNTYLSKMKMSTMDILCLYNSPTIAHTENQGRAPWIFSI